MYAKADLGSTTCEVVAFFDDEDELHNVVEELQIVGFDHAEMSVMPSRKVVEKIIGHELRTVVEVADDPDVARFRSIGVLWVLPRAPWSPVLSTLPRAARRWLLLRAAQISLR
jgi:hypothetical protein